MKKIVLLALLSAASGLALGCNGDDNTDGGLDSGPDTGADVVSPPDAGDAGNNPPALKTQIDRVGRPVINTALNHGFDSNAAAAGAAKDTYNADKNIAGWAATYGAEFERNLAILDGLDNVCGNQVAYSNGYAALAGVTADDRLYVDTSKSTCSLYLGVELNATGLQSNTDCGGRKLDYDVIDSTFTAASGSAIGDGIGAPAKTNGTTFPYLAAPQ
jgi:hypothetical protein